jgi:hypothetical protein
MIMHEYLKQILYQLENARFNHVQWEFLFDLDF